MSCAYCKIDDKLTREHIVPAYIYRFQKAVDKNIIGWNKPTGKMVGGEAKVKDVCALCNGGFLSELDNYSKSFLVDSGLLMHNYTKNMVELKYDYDLLLRWLLKVSYNASRTDHEQSHYFDKYISYIRGESATPDKNHLSVVVQMVAPELFQHSNFDKEKFLKLSAGSNILNPFLMRISYGYINGGSGYTLRIVIVGALMFQLLMFDRGILAGHAAVEVKRVLKIEKKSKYLTPKSKFITLYPGTMSWIDLYKQQRT